MNRTHLHDQVLAVLRDQGPETARFVAVRVFGLHPNNVFAWWRRSRYLMPELQVVDRAIGSLRRRGLLEVAGKSDRDRRQNVYGLTARAAGPELADLPPLTVTNRKVG